jgi:periplasmic iron binding protein
MAPGRLVVMQRWTGPIVVLLILSGVVLILLLNLNVKGRNPQFAKPADHPAPVPSPTTPAPVAEGAGRGPAPFREYPIGEAVERNQMRIIAVWLPMVQMEGMPGPPPSDIIHLEADIHATEGNRNGCAKDEFIPYLTVHYTIEPADAGKKGAEPIRGDLIPMVARDGWHYGASILMPKPGRYKLTYTIEPPSKPVGRHSDPVTGVDPWWKPFAVTFDWDYPGPALMK